MAHHLSCGVAPQRCRLLRIDLLEAMLSSQLVEYSKEERKRVRQRPVEIEDGQSISHLSSHSIQLQPGVHRNSKRPAGCRRLRVTIIAIEWQRLQLDCFLVSSLHSLCDCLGARACAEFP
jgi:hypothetical protein